MKGASALKCAYLATTLFTPFAAMAQDAPHAAVAGAPSIATPPQQQVAPPQEIVVTGSRVATSANSPTPVTMVDTAALATTTPSNLPTALNKLPVFMGSQSSTSRTLSGANNSSGDALNLRNFGVQRNLVLLDGHRLAPNNANGSVNTDLLPEMLIERVDVVTGGASAVYGSDAVTGVINFVLNKKFNGLKTDFNVGTNDQGLGTQYKMGVAAGTSLFGGRGHIEGTFRYSHQAQVLATQLPYGKDGQAYALAGNGTAAAPYFVVQDARRSDQPFGGLVSCAGCAANGETFVGNGVLGPYDAGSPTSPATPLLTSGGGGRYDLAPGVVTRLKTLQGFGRFSYDIGDSTTFYVEGRFGRSANFNNGPNNGLPPGTGAAARPNIFYTDNPFLTPATRAMLEAGNTSSVVAPDGTTHQVFSFVNYQGALTGQSPALSAISNLPIFAYGSTDRTISGTIGFEGTIADRFHWDVDYDHDDNRGTTKNPNNTNFQKLYASQDAVQLPNGSIVCYVSTTQYANLYPGCVPTNPFGPSSLTADSYAYYNTPTKFVMTNRMDDVSGSISGNVLKLPAGPVKLALSGEARWMSYKVDSNAPPGNVDCTGLRLCDPVTPLWFQTTIGNVSAKENVWEGAAEFNVPILKDIPLVKDLSMDLAGRYTKYSVSGVAKTWKIGVDYRVNDSIRFRGTVSADIRAPTLNDLFAPVGQAVTPLTDLYTGKTADLVQFSRGNPDLKPEKARTYSGGVVLTPSFVPGLMLSVDYYKITLKDAITTISYSTQAVQQICIDAVNAGQSSVYCDLATRPFPMASDNSQANFPTSITQLSLNSAVQKTKGFDIEADYRVPMDDLKLPGALNLKLLVSIQPYLKNIALPGSAPTLTPQPKTRVNLFVNYAIGDWNIDLQDRWLSSWNQATFEGQLYANQRIAAFNQLDATIDKTFFKSSGKPLDVYISVQDLFNKVYPIVPQPLSTSNPGLFYPVPTGWGNVLGRFWTFGIRKSF